MLGPPGRSQEMLSHPSDNGNHGIFKEWLIILLQWRTGMGLRVGCLPLD